MALRTPNDAASDADTAYRNAVGRIPLISAEEERALADAYATGDAEAGKKLVSAHLRFVITVARRYRGCGIPQADLIQEGNVGLLRALAKYKTDYRSKKNTGVRFLSYAHHWVRAMIMVASRRRDVVNAGSTKHGRMVSKYRRFVARHEQRTGLPPTDEQVGDHLGLSPEDMRVLRKVAAVSCASLDAPLSNDADAAPVMDLHASAQPTQEELLDELRDTRRVRGYLEAMQAQVNAIEKSIIEERLLGQEPVRTLDDIALQFGRSRERVRQLETRVKGRLKKGLNPQPPQTLPPS